MPSTPGDGRGRQLPIPHPRKLDRYGLCAHDCECARCNLGFRPSIADRDAARRAFERFEAMKKADADAAAGTDQKTMKKRARREAWRDQSRYTDEIIARLTVPVVEPATPEQLADLRRQYPDLNKRRKPR